MVDAAAQQNTRASGGLTVLACCHALTPLGLHGFLSRSLAGINASWVSLTNDRLEENFKLPRQLTACTSLPVMLRVYCDYCQTAIEQYHRGFGNAQQITLSLMREVPEALVRSAASLTNDNQRALPQSTLDDRLQ
jgi:hypothetical protein